jgi:hypothetical protein
MSELVKKIRTSHGDLQIDYEALANLPMIINPNLLINSDFRNPINQRGKTTYATALDWTYSIDRWKFIGLMTVNTDNKVLTLTNNDTPATWFMQELEHELPADTYTLTAKIVSVSGTCDMKVENSNGILVEKQITGAGIVTATVNGKVGAVTFELNGTDGKLVIEWVKLEVGYDSTAFSPRPYSEELVLCQRYAYAWKPIDHYTLAYHIFKSNSSSINFSVQLPFVMRTSPSLSVLGGGVSCVYNDNFNETYGSTSIELDIANEYTAKVKASYGITFPMNEPVEFFAYSSLGLLFDAEVY